MEERDQAEEDLKAKWVDHEIFLNNGLRNYAFAVDDTAEKRGLDSLHCGPI